MDKVATASATWSDLMPQLIEKAPHRLAKWLILKYTSIGAAALPHTSVFDVLADRFKKIEVAFVASKFDEQTVCV